METHEISLTGGRITNGVVRVGNTVRRPLNGNSWFAHKLLIHLEHSCFKGAPRFLGIDHKQREILTYIEGCVPDKLATWLPYQLVASVRLMRQFHDTAASSLLRGEAEVVCHGDLSPCNTVFQNDLPVAFIDFDNAGPGSRLDDLAYAAWLWLCIGDPEREPVELGRRLALFTQAYGWGAQDEIIPALLAAQERLYRQALANATEYAQSTAVWAAECRQWVAKHRARLACGLASGYQAMDGIT